VGDFVGGLKFAKTPLLVVFSIKRCLKKTRGGKKNEIDVSSF
jgi:hypothetical protein